MTNKNGMTIKQGFERALNVFTEMGDEEMIAFFTKRLEQEAKKSTNRGERKPTSHQQENEKIKIGILQNMIKGETYSIPEMLSTFDCFPPDMSQNRLASLLTQLGARGTKQVKRIEGKGRAYYSLV